MKIYLLSNDKTMTNYWQVAFYGVPDIEIVCEDFERFMNNNKVDCIVSPANSYGIMDGGYDLAITRWFGSSLMQKIQNYIIKHYRGEQPVGTSFIIDTNKKGIKLIHTPTMRVPSVITDNIVVYHAMRSTLLVALDNKVQSIIIPAFGGLSGAVPQCVVAALMREAYDQIMNPPKKLNWDYAERVRLEERYR